MKQRQTGKSLVETHLPSREESEIIPNKFKALLKSSLVSIEKELWR